MTCTCVNDEGDPRKSCLGVCEKKDTIHQYDMDHRLKMIEATITCFHDELEDSRDAYACGFKDGFISAFTMHKRMMT